MALGFIETLCISLVGGSLSGLVAYRIQEKKLRKEFLLQDSAQRVALELMSDGEWPLRSFKVIRHHLGGFKDMELRRILVRTGAIRFMSKSGEELWGLVARNKDLLGVTQLDVDPTHLSDEGLFLEADEEPGSR